MPTHFPLKIKTKYGIELTAPFLVSDYPIFATVPYYEKPPIPLSRERPDLPQAPIWNHLLVSQADMAKHPGFSFVPMAMYLQNELMQVLFKTAHAYCYFHYLFKRNFEPYLTSFILDHTKHPPNDPLRFLIGKSPESAGYLPGRHHVIKHVVEEIDGAELLKVRIRLFAFHNGSQTYEVIAGHLLPAP